MTTPGRDIQGVACLRWWRGFEPRFSGLRKREVTMLRVTTVAAVGLIALAVGGAKTMAADASRASTVIPVTLKSFDKANPKETKVEYENKSGKEISRVQGSLSFTDKAGKVLFTTGVTEDVGKWAADAKSERKPFAFFNVPPELAKALEENPASVTITFKASVLKYTDGTEEKF
jgi:hypothetical protein